MQLQSSERLRSSLLQSFTVHAQLTDGDDISQSSAHLSKKGTHLTPFVWKIALMFNFQDKCGERSETTYLPNSSMRLIVLLNDLLTESVGELAQVM